MTDPVVLAVGQFGGVASHAKLCTLVSRHRIQRAVAQGLVVRVGRGRYALPGLDDAMAAAVRLNGTVSHRSAAVLNGWQVRHIPRRPEIIVPRHRDVLPARRRGVHVRWRPVSRVELLARVTEPLRTVIDCARDLPLEEALPIADSALRAGDVTQAQLREAISGLPRTGRARAELVLRHSSSEAANVFESTLRALSIEAVGTLFRPQITLDLAGERIRPDLVCRELQLVVEADSFTFHTERHQLTRDCWRYNELVLEGWLVIRFTWDQVMFQQEWVMDVIRRAVAQRTRAHST